MSVIIFGNRDPSGRDHLAMGTINMRRTAVGLLAAALTLGTLAACGGDDSDQDSAGATGEPGTVTDEEFLGHRLREVPADGAPVVELRAQADEHGGWNLQLATERFTFTPDRTGGEARGGQGHAHVYVDDEKFSRAYGEWFFLPAGAVGDGEHTVLVTLNADDHTVWATGGEPVTASTTVTGGEDGHTHGDGGTTPPAPTEPAEDAEVFAFEITGGQADPPLDRAVVEQGATVRIEVTSDQPDEVHLHGYDLSAPVGPGEQGVIEFVADRSGLFELETHETGLVLLQLQVQ